MDSVTTDAPLTPQQIVAMLTPEAASALFTLAYRAGLGDTQARPPDLCDPALEALRDAARREVGGVRSERSFTLADLCAREGLTTPPADDGIESRSVLLRAYRAPTARTPMWTITNTGGRRYRFSPDSPACVERCNGGTWEGTPAGQVPLVVIKLQRALALTPSRNIRQQSLVLGRER